VNNYSLQAKAYHFVWNCVDLAFSAGVHRLRAGGNIALPECRHTLEFASLNSCIYCGRRLPQRGICLSCQSTPHAIEELRYVADYQGILREAIHRLKYEGDLGIALMLSEMMAQIANSTDWQLDLVMPVPLSVKRQAQRGYNQAVMLAYPLSLKLQRPLNTKGLVRLQETRSQVFLNYRERQENVQGAFLADPNIVKEKVILLIDDVFTTGATINAAATALREAGCTCVFALTAAKALGRQTGVENPGLIDV